MIDRSRVQKDHAWPMPTILVVEELAHAERLNSLVRIARTAPDRVALYLGIRWRWIRNGGRQQQRLLRRCHPQDNVKDQARSAKARQENERDTPQGRVPSICDGNSLTHASDNAAQARTNQAPLGRGRRNCIRTVKGSADGMSAIWTVPRVRCYWLATTAAVVRHCLLSRIYMISGSNR